MNKTVNLFVLAGCWECPDDIGVTVVAISSDEKQLIDRLDQIADTQAKEYVSIEGSILMESIQTLGTKSAEVSAATQGSTSRKSLQ